MTIFTDLHNSGLAYSLYLLFEKRLGHKLFFPIGMEWADEGYWQIHKPYNYSQETAKQYLQIRPEYIPKDGTQVLNKVISEDSTHYEVEDIGHEYTRKHITLDQFKNMEIDIVIATIPEHIETFKKLAAMKGAKFILQVGNIWWDKSIDFSKIPNLMSATIQYPVPSSTNVVWYHEEFNDFFSPSDLLIKKQVTSFINCLPQTGHAQKWYEMKIMMPDFDFKSYGGSCDDGVINTNGEISRIMKNSCFGWHCKMYGDGYGLIFHQWFASGKPIITCFSDYKDKLGGRLLIDMETAIDADTHTLDEICDIMQNMHPNKHQYMCQRAREVFEENVDFERDATNVKEFLERLI